MSSDPVVSFDPWHIDAEIPEGETMLAAGESVGADIEALCGGNGICGTCAVEVQAGGDHLSPVNDTERDVLSADQLEAGYRLACQSEVHGDVSVHVPPESRSQGAIIMTEGEAIEYELNPSVQLHHASFDAPTLTDHVPDRERVVAALNDQYDDVAIDDVDFHTLRRLPGLLRESEDDGRMRVAGTVFEETELLTVTPGRSRAAYGLAVDVGTTTLAVYLVDLLTGEVAAVSSRLNPQRDHGEDIISRVQYTVQEASGAEELQDEIIQGINRCIAEVRRTADIDFSDIVDAVFVGNTAMHHLFLGIEAGAVARSPYVPASRATIGVKARALGLNVNDAAYATWFPLIGGYVGADFVADLLAGHVLERAEPTLCIDIGTNGEMAVFDGEDAWVASAPAGPALEGAEITRGVRAKPGAIETVSLDPETWEATIEVIDDEAPIGICGSGILDVVAQLFLVGAINRRGRLIDPADGRGHIRETDDGDREFVLLTADEAGIGSDIVVSQEDIRAIQNAKAAIQTGANVLLEAAGVTTVETLVMAGGFGNYIDPESAKLLGMYPEVGIDQVEFLGNAAGYGAMYGLMNEDARRRADEIVTEVEYVELAAWDGFHEQFMQAMYLPHRDFDRYPSVRETIGAVREIEDEGLH